MGRVASRSAVVAGAVAFVFLMTGCSGERSCVDTETKTSVSDTSLAPGESVTVSAPYQWSNCYDSGKFASPPPLKEVSVSWRQEGVETQLATAYPDANAFATVVVQVPVNAKVGAAELQIGTASSAAITITRDPK